MDRLADSYAEGGGGTAATRTPILDGFSGPLDFLVRQAGSRRSGQPGSAANTGDCRAAGPGGRQAPPSMPLGQTADWVVMASWILLLRSNLMLSQEEEQKKEAEIEAGQLCDRLLALLEIQALARCLQRRPQLDRDVFARGNQTGPEE